MTVLTRNELEKLSKEEVIDDLFTINSIYEELANLSSTFDEFLQNIPVWNLNLKCQKYSRMKSELEVSKNYTKPLSKKMRYCKETLWTLLSYLRIHKIRSLGKQYVNIMLMLCALLANVFRLKILKHVIE